MSHRAFARKAADAYVRLVPETDIESARHHAGRFTSPKKRKTHLRPGPQWRQAITEVLGDDPFDDLSRLAVLEGRQAKVAEAVDFLIATRPSMDAEILELRVRIERLERELAQARSAPTRQEGTHP